jgi:hypothetical protein
LTKFLDRDEEVDIGDDLKAVMLGRNTPCPCGSGKKWKRCCGGATKPPNLYCSWMCEVDFNALHARSGKEPCPNCESALTGGRPNADLSKCVVCKGTGVV